MGHIVNPITFRLGASKHWNSIWSVDKFNNSNFTSLFLSDFFFFFFLKNLAHAKVLKKMSIIFSHFKILRNFNKLTYVIYFFNGSFLHNSINFRKIFFNKIYQKFILYRFWVIHFLIYSNFRFYKIYNLKNIKYLKFFCFFFFFCFYKKILFLKNFFIDIILTCISKYKFSINLNEIYINFLYYKKLMSFLNFSLFKFVNVIMFKILVILKLLIKKYIKKNFITFNFLHFNNFYKKNYLIYFPEFFFFQSKFKHVFEKYLNYYFCFFKNYINLKKINIIWKMLHPFQLTASIVSQYMCIRLLQRFRLNEALKPVVRGLLRNKTLKGFRIICSGRFSKKEIATYQVKTYSSIPSNSIDSILDYSFSDVVLKYSLCGVKVFLNKKYISRKKKKKLYTKNIFITLENFIDFFFFFLNIIIIKLFFY